MTKKALSGEMDNRIFLKIVYWDSGVQVGCGVVFTVELSN
jgi:hypothetical protein